MSKLPNAPYNIHMTQAANCFFQINAQGHTPKQVTLAGSQQIIGRSPEVDITLADQTVSRQHAEVYADAHGRWWIKDLKSRNGTLVNGQRISVDHLLESNDTVEIEHFTLTFNVLGDLPSRKAARPGTHAALNVNDNPIGPITRLDAQQAPPIDAQHLQTLIRFAEDLLITEDANERLLKLARILISKLYHGIMAVTFDLKIANPDEPADMLIEPQFAHNWGSGETPYISRTLLRSVIEHQAPVIATNTDSADDSVMALSLADDKQSLAALACPINITQDSMQILYANFPAEFGTMEWLALASLAVEQYKQTNTAWIARIQAQEQAAMQKELEQASRIQNSLIPHTIELDQADLAIGFEPCKYIGGDYVDIRPVDDGKIYI
ncbi:MAG: FHA domain-containing protein, partial [Phycisphaeraceae bacterium]|nr:FHA domain-containing protein [Phycisphaeraceae bacterium]